MKKGFDYGPLDDANKAKKGETGRSLVSGPDSSTTDFSQLAPRQDGIPIVANEAMKSGGTTLKVITFHHAGADMEHGNTALFHMRGSVEHAGRVSATAVFLFLFMLTDRETVSNSFVARDRGGTPCTRGRECDLLESHYWIHSANPEDPNDILYDFPILPHMSTWQIPRALPSQWSRGGPESAEKTRSWVPNID
jgi:hypothetical protein